MIFKTTTLGCKVNQYETQWIRSAFLANGWEDGDASERPDAEVDLVIVNTCSVTAESDAKSRKVVAKYAKSCPNAEIVVVGCYAASDPQGASQLPRVSEIVSDKRDLPKFFRSRGLEIIPTGVAALSERRRAYVKVQDGCRVGCAYCIIPTTRPYLESRKINDVLAEAKALAANGYQEIVVTGVHLGHYGLDFYPPTPEEEAAAGEGEFGEGESSEAERRRAKLPLERYLARQALVPESERVDLATLLDALVSLRLPHMRFRLGSLEAVEVSEKLLDVVANNPGVVCPHFHLSMQSGDDEVLANMKRRWLSEPYIAKCEEIYRRIPDAALTTDVIVGFPGETDAQFERTVEVVKALHFSRTHVFRFSARPGTIAAQLPNPVPPEVKKDRAAVLGAVARAEREAFAKRFLGKRARLIVESESSLSLGAQSLKGTTDRYYEVDVPLGPRDVVEPGKLVDVELTELRGDVFIGRLLR